ncbi:hypothetical protein [Cupriavidus lacunae]|uniref:hypothetical protein n=1 Tax=Cupriavidus lacunae TaxID=2666307 RepID=UPI0010586DC3|nr:hypothetical protein [Cupriavidus lacunae]
MPNINLPDDQLAPDTYTGEGFAPPADDFVICRDQDGNIRAHYSQLNWDVTPYHSRGKPLTLYLTRWQGKLTGDSLTSKIQSQIHWIMFLVMWKRPGKPLAVVVLPRYLSVLNELAKIAYAKNKEIFHLLENPIFISQYISTASPNKTKGLSALLRILYELGPLKTGIAISSRTTIEEVAALVNSRQKDDLQTPPIPTRIYSEFLRRLLFELHRFEKVSPAILALCAQYCAPRYKRQDIKEKYAISKTNSLSLNLAAYTRSDEEHEHVMEYLASTGKQLTSTDLGKVLNEVQYLCALTILAYSGMRTDEARCLPYDCIEDFYYNGRKHYLLCGVISKNSPGSGRPQKWVTSHAAIYAIGLARKVADVIYEYLNGPLGHHSTSAINLTRPLFVSTGYLPIIRAWPEDWENSYAPKQINAYDGSDVVQRLCLTVTAEDVEELRRIDPEGPWMAKIVVGQMWPFGQHQLRRSLALYACRSGLVSLPSLRRQLGHITLELSAMYSAGSEVAVNLLAGDKKHFGVEYQATLPESEALAYILNVLESDERLYGSHGTYVELKLRTGAPVSKRTRDETKRQVKKGVLAYHETPLGGCTNIEPCADPLMKSVSSCIGCNRGSVIKLSKLESAITSQQGIVDSLNPSSVEARTETQELEELRRAHQRLMNSP